MNVYRLGLLGTVVAYVRFEIKTILRQKSSENLLCTDILVDKSVKNFGDLILTLIQLNWQRNFKSAKQELCKNNRSLDFQVSKTIKYLLYYGNKVPKNVLKMYYFKFLVPHFL